VKNERETFQVYLETNKHLALILFWTLSLRMEYFSWWASFFLNTHIINIQSFSITVSFLFCPTHFRKVTWN